MTLPFSFGYIQQIADSQNCRYLLLYRQINQYSQNYRSNVLLSRCACWFLGYRFHISGLKFHFLSDFPRLYISHTKPTFWLNCWLTAISSQSTLSTAVCGFCFQIYTIVDSFQWNSGKNIDYKSTSKKSPIINCFWQSTILWRDENCKLARLTHNFTLILIVYMSAINTQLGMRPKTFHFAYQYTGQLL